MTSQDGDYRTKWLEKMEFLQHVTDQHDAVIMLFDASAYRFIYMSDRGNILGGYTPEDFTSETGVDFSFHNIHPDHRSAALVMQIKIITYGMEHTMMRESKTVANMICQYKKKSGEYIRYLQKFTAVEFDSTGYPLLYLRYGYNISHLVKSSVALIINSPGEIMVWNYNTNNKILEQANVLTTQEKKILQFLSEGKPSREIADLLFLSPHTVDTHRRNLLKKTNCIDSTAMIAFSKMTGLI